MESFIVSALKYRPKTFSEVIGQDSITKTLENSIKINQLAQALLFCGPRGVGKTSCARILANMINDNKKLYGLDLNSKFEKSPGLKDIEKIGKLFNLEL